MTDPLRLGFVHYTLFGRKGVEKAGPPLLAFRYESVDWFHGAGSSCGYRHFLVNLSHIEDYQTRAFHENVHSCRDTGRAAPFCFSGVGRGCSKAASGARACDNRPGSHRVQGAGSLVLPMLGPGVPVPYRTSTNDIWASSALRFATTYECSACAGNIVHGAAQAVLEISEQSFPSGPTVA